MIKIDKDRSLHDIFQYQLLLGDLFNDINIPASILHCNPIYCQDTEHLHDIELFYQQIVMACTKACRSCIPKRQNQQTPSKKYISGWTEYVEPFKQKSIFWNSIWLENGAPRNGTLADIRRSIRAQYHYAIRHAQKVKDQRIANKLATKVFNSGPNEFWNNVRHMKGKG